MNKKKGFMMFAYNNEQIDYTRLALIAALAIKKYMPEYPVVLVTNQASLDHCSQTAENRPLMLAAWDEIIITNPEYQKNTRQHNDGAYYSFNAQFTNTNKHDIYNISPFEETILIDTDYICGNANLANLFGGQHDVYMYRNAKNLRCEEPYLNERWLHSTGIRMWWSTVVYWRKSEESKHFFNIWAVVKENWEYYRFLYKFPGTLYRTDYAASIAAHLCDGWRDGGFIGTIPGFMRYQDQCDDLIKVCGANRWIMLSNLPEEWKNLVVEIANEDVHMMNKRSIERHYDAIIKELE
jgi:hypothetical protein